MEERLNNLLELFLKDGDLVGYVTGREIIEKMGLANKEYLQAYDIRSYYNNTLEIEEFFEYSRNILEINPGHNLASSIWIDNSYGLRLEWQREMKLRNLLDK
jgi:ADP-glucose pyrophosphorylase